MASSSAPLSLCCLLLLLPLSTLAQNPGENRQFRSRHEECRLERITGLQPRHRLESEAGVSEYFDGNEQQLQCAGVTVIRRTIKSGGLFLPAFSNSPGLTYVIEGSGIAGLLVPGCPESFQSFEEQGRGGGQGQRQPFTDQHQKIFDFRQGDIIAVPAGFVRWCYNNGDRPLVTISLVDTSSSANQLDSTHRQFMLAGSRQKGESKQGSSSGGHLLRAFDTKLLAEALGVPEELAQKIQREDSRGEMVMVSEGLKLIRSSSRSSGGEEEAEHERETRDGAGDRNGLEEALCTYRLRQNIDNPRQADYFNPQAGWITKLSAQKLPILRRLRLSARRGVMRPRATLAPQWVINAHDIVYVTKGRARVQVASDEGRVHDGELRQGQLLVVPQNFVAIVSAEEEGFEWVTFKTNEDALDSQIAGKLSVLKGMPVDVIANAYRLSREEAFKLKFGRRDEIEIFADL
ncbi:Glutelin type-A 1 [Platanthera zijinensis]|uniref:Glutelin type-A 1 n=1 Tax=Platanthera zijinensis TaxID=2320716 RepID=A0AAP0G6U9_9ASPA